MLNLINISKKMDLYTTNNFYFWIISGLLLDISISLISCNSQTNMYI